MINRNLIKAINSAWLIEPNEGMKWAAIALDLLRPDAATPPIGKYDNVESQPYMKGDVMVLPVNGPLMKNENCGAPGTANMLETFKQALSNPAITGIVLQIDSPGGTVDGTQVFADAIKAAKKPVVTYVDGLMASAAMWIGSAAREIIASTATDTVGSIGTMVQWADFTEAYKQKGIKVHTAYASQSTDKNRVFSDASASGNYTELIKNVLDPINSNFTNAIQKNRAGKIDLQNENVLTGKTYMAKQAIKYGLVDKIGSLDYAVKRVQQLANEQQQLKMENNTAFERTIAATGTEGFEVVEGGFLATEEQLTAIENTLAQNEQAFVAMRAAAEEAGANLTELQQRFEAANQTNGEQLQQIETLQARVAELEARPGADFKKPIATKDEIDGGKRQQLSSITEEMNKKRAMLGLEPIE